MVQLIHDIKLVLYYLRYKVEYRTAKGIFNKHAMAQWHGLGIVYKLTVYCWDDTSYQIRKKTYRA